MREGSDNPGPSVDLEVDGCSITSFDIDGVDIDDLEAPLSAT
jgi:hypothetical protein